MVNTSYGMRHVTAKEVRDLFGSAEAALKATGGEERLALFYIHNPGLCRSAAAVKAVDAPLADDLRVMRDSERAAAKEAAAIEREDELQRKAAASFYAGRLKSKGSVTRVMKACGVGRPRAEALVEAAKLRGLI